MVSVILSKKKKNVYVNMSFPNGFPDRVISPYSTPYVVQTSKHAFSSHELQSVLMLTLEILKSSR
jgi:hypothetical protein